MFKSWLSICAATASLVLFVVTGALAGAAPPLERSFINQPTDANGNAMPLWAWAPSIAELDGGSLLAAFKGSALVGGAVNVETSDASAIYFSSKAANSNTWSTPRQASFDTIQVAEGNIQLSVFGNEVWATYFGRPRPANGNWTNGQFDASLYLRKSTDGGLTWSADTILRAPTGSGYSSTQGTVNAANPIRLSNGNYIIPFNNDGDGGYYGGVLRSTDGGNTWSESRMPQPATTAQSSMPTVQQLPNGDLVAFLRTYGVNGDTSQQLLHRSISTNGGVTWSTPVQLADIKNPNSRIDAQVLSSGEIALAGNDAIRLPGLDGATGRKEVNLMLTSDLGLSLIARKTLAMSYDMTVPNPAGFNEWGYPSLIQSSDGQSIHVVYGSRNDKKPTQLSQIVYAKVDRNWFNMPDPVLWFDAADVDNDSDPYNDPSDNTTLATWVDRRGQDASGVNRNATNGNNATRPSFQINEIDGKPVVRFVGTSSNAGDFLATPALSASTVAGSGKNQATIMAVVKQNDINRGGVIFGWQSKATDPKNRMLIQNGYNSTTGEELLRFDFQDDTDAHRLVGTTPLADGEYHILAAIMDGATMSIYIDGELEASMPGSGVLTNGSTAAAYLGAILGNTAVSAFGSFDMAELLLYNQALTPLEAGYSGYYLSHKYDISSTYKVPEPASLALIGLGGMWLLSRRRHTCA